MSNQPNNNCIVYCRVSTTKSAQEGESLDTQESICRSFIAGKGFTIVPGGNVFRETFSGRADTRPILDEVFEYIKQHPGTVRYFIFRVIDRFTRGGSYSYEKIKMDLARLGVEMIDTYGVIQPPKNTLEHVGFEYAWSKTSPSEIAEIVMASSAKAEVTNILTRLIGREIELTQQGYKVRQSEDGYLNHKIYVDGKKKVIQIPDPDRAQFFREMFRLRAAGNLTDPKIADRINAMGYKTKVQNRWNESHEKIIGIAGGLPLTAKRMQEIIRRPIYCGIVSNKWTRGKPVKAQYEGLVTIDTFNRANRGRVAIKSSATGLQILYNCQPERVVAKYDRHNPLFPYKNLALCPHCRKPLLGSSPKGESGKRYPTYHCGRGHQYFGVPKARLDGIFEKFLGTIRLNPAGIKNIEATLRKKYEERKSEITRLAGEAARTVADLKTEQKAKIDAFAATTSPILRSRLEQEVEELEGRISQAGQHIPAMVVSDADLSAFIESSKSTMELLPESLVDSSNPPQQEALFDLIFDSKPTFPEIVNGTPKMSCFFWLFLDSPMLESVRVHPSGFRWNSLEVVIVKWKEFSELTNLQSSRARVPALPRSTRHLKEDDIELME